MDIETTVTIKLTVKEAHIIAEALGSITCEEYNWKATKVDMIRRTADEINKQLSSE